MTMSDPIADMLTRMTTMVTTRMTLPPEAE